MKKYILIVCLLTLLVTSDDVKPADDACTCAKLMSENDCKAKSGCAWTAGTPASGTTAATQGSCATATATSPTTPTVAAYCSSVTDPATKCAKTIGCCYVDSKCTHFTGCSAYVKTTNADCQAISTLCITDGTQCTDAKSCNEYTTQTACETNPSISGIKKCKWDNGACRDYVCTEAASTLTTNADCSAWLSGCITTGKGCTLTLGACAAYTGDDVACGGLKGTDGNCEGVANGTNCRARTCAGAANTLTTNTDCAAYQIGCVTNGKGCVTAPLPACASYSGDNTTCVGYIGSDGTCEGDAGATNCRARICTNASTSNNTDALCASYKAGCVTTGKGCIATRGACSSYSGTTTSCVGYIGSDGFCKGTTTTASPCAPKVCTEAPLTTNTDTACAAYQTNCKTTGKGCVISLGPCSSYTGTSATCDGYVGTDGKCKGNATSGPCAPKVCTEAPASTTTNEACAQYQNNCVTNGAGCVDQTSCISTIKQISCTGTSSCGWNSICVASSNCSDFLTASICSGNNAVSGPTSTPCYWNGSSCRNLACTDAPSTYNTDTLCNTFLSGCWTKGNGCLAQSAPCSSYSGTQTTCATFSKKCWNISGAISTTPCTDRTCADDITSTSDTACGSFKTGCRTKGTGCIDPTSLCNAYQGTQSQCDAFRGSNGTIRCWNAAGAAAVTACTVKACSDNTTATTDTDCGTFLDGCVTNGAGCILKSAACSSYTGTQIACGAFKGSNGANICWYANAAGSGSCVNKDCTHASNTLTTDSDCEGFLTGCRTNGHGCVSQSTACSSYNGNVTECSAFTGASKKCYKADSCADRLCADKATAANNAECTTYLSTCRYFKGGCVNAGVCTTYNGTSLAECQDVLDNSGTPLKCWWTAGTSCTARTCGNAPNTVASQTDCNNHVATGCMYNGNNQCVLKGTCGSYTAPGADDTARGNNCKAMTDTSGNACWFTTGSTTCTDRTCANVPTTPAISGQSTCDAHKTGCQYNGNAACVNQGACNTYTVSGTNAEMIAKCQAMKNTSSKACIWATGTTCEEVSCENAPSPTAQANCDTHLANSCSFSVTCGSRTCAGATSKTTFADCNTWLAGCQWNGATSCQDKAATCAAIVLTSAADAAAKKSVCEGTATTAAPPKSCQLASAGTACEDRTCAGASSQTSSTTCNTWLANCQWDGVSGCVDQSAACPVAAAMPATANTAALKKLFCEAFTTSTSSGKCQLKSGDTECESRTCAGATSQTSSITCDTWMATCQWDGVTSCVAQSAACPVAAAMPATANTAALKKLFCEAFTTSTSSGKCQLKSGDTECESRTCAGATSQTSSITCDTWMVTCQWDGVTSCVAQSPACPVQAAMPATANTPFLKKQFCDNFTTSSSGKCQLKSGDQECESRTCAGATSQTSSSTCNTWMATCQWNGVTSCVPQTSACPVTGAMPASANTPYLKKQFCDNFTTSSSGKCQLKSGDQECETRSSCAGASSQTSSTTCNTWLANCQWDGVSGCVAQTSGCPSSGIAMPDNADTEALKKLFCEAFTTSSSSGKCQLNAAKTVCEARTCIGASSQTSTSCDTWMTTCQWDGVTSCVAQSPACPVQAAMPATANTAALKKLFCEAFTTSTSSGKCQLKSGDTECESRACTGASSQTSTTCDTWMTTCQWDGVTSCVAQSPACPVAAAMPATANTAALKKLFCEAFTTSTSSGKCQLKSGDTECESRACTGASSQTSSTTCNNTWMATCQWDGVTSCVAQTAACPTAFTTQTTDATKQAFCEAFTTSTSSGKCQLNAGKTACEARTCASKTNATSATDCTTWLSTCRYNGTSTCIDAVAACTSYTISNAVSNLKAICESLTDSSSGACQQGTPSCAARTCANAVSPTSNTDCSNWLSTCVYTGAGCVTKDASCSSYTPTGADNTAKRTICTGLTSTAASNNDCVYVDAAATCADKTCSNVYPTTVTKATCEAWLTSCRYVGTTCQAAAACNTITIVGTTDADKATFCSGIKDNSGTPIACIYYSTTSTTLCSARTCANIPTTPATDTDCTNHLSTCKLSNTATASCVDVTTACSGYQGTADQCKTFTGSNGSKPCWSTSTTTAACMDKACTHNTTATTDVECNEFLSGCKTNGGGCVAGNTACSTFSGNATTCVIRKAADATNYCKFGASVSGSCKDKSCSDDAASTTDSQCESFMSTCATRGTGCIPKSEPCTSYRGTQITCAAFKGSNGVNKCWNTSAATATTACANKKCSDDTTSTTDTACAASLADCVTKGAGCIEKTAPCSAYTGTQATCSTFKGINGTVLCWNLSAAPSSTACVDKACIHNTTATTDADCDTFLPKPPGSTTPRCVTDGSGCEAYPRSCSQFTGTTEQCGKFTANDGPCKSTVTTGSGTCTPRICTEALNTNNTEALCQAYHPTCHTTGYGCVTSVPCSNVSDQNACAAKTGCSWVNNCRSIGADCTALTASGASICVNTPVTTGTRKCAWQNNACRAVTCQDLSNGLKTDDACKAQLSTCTTKGDGCITKGTCSTYSTETICKAAKTTDVGDTCIWDNNACRAKKCTDATTGTTTDDGCNTFLTGCKTNGQTCISSGFNCTSLVTNAACQKDGSNKPCLWVNSVCYNYVRCEDINMTTHTACQAFSPLCTTDGTKCIAINTCTKTQLQVSCIIGTDGTCGWLPAVGANAAKCQKFGACSDAVSADKPTCMAYGSTCITDGTKCIATGTCGTYTTQIACETGGTDGTCIFSSNACRLRECTDATATNASSITTHSGCYSFSAKTKCTTNGTSCIALATCSSYTIEAGCELGTDGICTWALPVGTTTTTTKSCRLKVCQDFTLATSAACSTALTGAGVETGCVSNGTNCIVKSTCSTYTNKEACNGGGTDGLCAFTPESTTTPTVGTCKLMTACSDANNDSLACAAKSAVCKWMVTTSGSTTTSACNAHDCTTKAVGTDCNPVPSFDTKTYSICISSSTGCVLGAGTSLTSASCYGDSLGTYTWNASTNTCTACFTRIPDNHPDLGGNTGSTYGTLLNTIAILLWLATMVA